MKRALLILLTLYSMGTFATPPIAMSYYDVGRLYDTIPSPFYDDKAYTPTGKREWTSDRYIDAIEGVVAVVDSMRMPIVALFGVETEEVVRDIVSRCEGDYSYIHRTLDYYDGRDFALLYYGDRLFIDHVRGTYHSLYVAGEIDGTTIDIHLTRRGEKLRSVLSPIEGRTPRTTIVAGVLSRADLKRLSLNDPLRASEKIGMGDTRNRRGWSFHNRIGVSNSTPSIASVYITSWLLAEGDDQYLPLYVFIEQKLNLP